MQLARALILAGVVLVALGFAVAAVAKFNLPIGRLPGDMLLRGKNSVVFIPWVTCLLLSALGTLLVWLLRRR